MSYDVSLIKATNIEALTDFLTYFEDRSQDFGSFTSVVDGQLVPASLSEQAQAFVDACHTEHFVQEFDWENFRIPAEKMMHDDGALATASLEDIGKLLTVHIHKNDKIDSHLLSMMKSGHIAKVLSRLLQIGAM
jgi:hypothetical protein